jgi:hypothetical protein
MARLEARAAGRSRCGTSRHGGAGGARGLGALIAGSALGGAFWLFALSSYISVLQNMNPLIELDGCYLFGDSHVVTRLEPRGRCLLLLPGAPGTEGVIARCDRSHV